MSEEPDRPTAVSPSTERTEFRLEADTDVLIASKPGLAGDRIAEGAMIKLARGEGGGPSTADREIDYQVVGSRYRLETDAEANVSNSVQEILVRRHRKPWYTRLSDGWQTAIGFGAAALLLSPFIYFFVIIPIVGSVISYQLESRGLVVLDDASRTIVAKDAAGARNAIDPYEAFKKEQEDLFRAFLGKRVVPCVPWLLFAMVGVVLPYQLAKKLGGKYYEDNQVLRSFFTLLGMALGLALVRYWQGFATPPKPLVEWPRDFADYFDYLQERGRTFWPIIAAWVVPLSLAVLKLIGLEGLGQLIEKLVSRKN